MAATRYDNTVCRQHVPIFHGLRKIGEGREVMAAKKKVDRNHFFWRIKCFFLLGGVRKGEARRTMSRSHKVVMSHDVRLLASLQCNFSFWLRLWDVQKPPNFKKTSAVIEGNLRSTIQWELGDFLGNLGSLFLGCYGTWLSKKDHLWFMNTCDNSSSDTLHLHPSVNFNTLI